MDIIPTRRNMLTVTPQDPRCVAIAGQFGDFATFVSRWKPERLAYITQNADRSIEMGIPALVMMMLTYGQENIQEHLKLMLVYAVKQMREDNIDKKDIETIARLITESKPLRLLNYAYVIAFLGRVMQGEYELYACKPHQFMAAFQKYAVTARARQDLLMRQKESAEEERRWQEHRKSAITFEEFKRRTGFKGDNPLDSLSRTGQC